MNFVLNLFLSSILLFLVTIIIIEAFPHKSKNSDHQLVYDQKQNGDYNIQVSLKDFKIFAILEDSSPEYEYEEYDYADFTVKPSSPISSTTTSTTATTLELSFSSASTTSQPIEVTTIDAIRNKSSLSYNKINETTNITNTLSNTKNSTNKIKVHILEEPLTFPTRKLALSNGNTPIISEEKSIHNSDPLQHKDSIEKSNRKCPQGCLMQMGRCRTKRNKLCRSRTPYLGSEFFNQLAALRFYKGLKNLS